MSRRQDKTASLRPSDMGETIESLLAKEKLPKRTDADLKMLEFCTVGISAVGEAIRSKPIVGLDQRGLTRYATRVALARMESSEVVVRIRDKYSDYLNRKKDLAQIERRGIDKMLWGLACGYVPFVAENNVHLWFWDESVKNAITSICSDSGIPKRFIYPFVADALSDIGSLSRITEDLVGEYRYGLRCLEIFFGALDKAVLDISQL